MFAPGVRVSHVYAARRVNREHADPTYDELCLDWTTTYFEEGYLKRWGAPPPRENTRAQVADLLILLNPAAGACVVDVACGRGNFAAEVAAAGFAVVGVDASRPLLSVAARHALDCGVKVDLVCGDMRELPLRSRCGAALLLDSFGFFERGGMTIEIQRVLHRNPSRIIEHLVIHDADPVTHYERRQRLYTKDELAELLRRSNFAVVGAFAGYGGKPFVETESAKLVMLAEAVDAA